MTLQTNLRSALYVGSVSHRRLWPSRHNLRYRMFWILFDLDEIDDLPNKLRLLSRNRFNALSLYDHDHGDGGPTSLREQVELHLTHAGIDCSGGKIQLLCMPRIFGCGFNPLSIYFCYDATAALRAILYEVHNTFGERHSYLIPAKANVGTDGALAQQCEKTFYVSPFMDMDLQYRFRLSAPSEAISVGINVVGRTVRILTAVLVGRRSALSDASILRVLTTHPVLPLKVITAIHWHAFLMLLKGFKLRSRPVPPRNTVTIVSREAPSQ